MDKVKKGGTHPTSTKGVMTAPYKLRKRRLSSRTRQLWEAEYKTVLPKFSFVLPSDVASFSEKKYKTAYREHRKRVLGTPTTIDDAPPLIFPHYQIKINQLWDEATDLDKIQRSKLLLLHKLSIIENSEGRIDNKPSSQCVKYPAQKGCVRQLWFMRISKENINFHKNLLKVKSVYDIKEWEKEYDKHILEMASVARYPEFYKKKLTCYEEEEGCNDPENAHSAMNYFRNISQCPSTQMLPRCFLDVLADGYLLGRIIIRLRSDIVPMTAANFLALCTGQLGVSYKGCQFHHIVPHTLLKTGDIVNKNGTSGRSIYGPSFHDENFVLMHTKIGMVAMANNGPNTNNSQFYITMKPLRTLDGKNVVFGRVIKGYDTLIRIQNYATATGRPKTQITISNCGLLYKCSR